uniref:Uncharacterized protein n=1 Tax=Cannabis sativa TaxID=3483 RepID=A0A803QWW4_CANSA
MGVSEEEIEKYRNYYNGKREKEISEVNPKPNNGLASKLIDWFEKLVVKLMYYNNSSSSSSALHFLSGNFTPNRHETPPTKDLHVLGYLPVSTSFTIYIL